VRGVAIFAKACFRHPSPSKRQKLNATANAFGAPDVLRIHRQIRNRARGCAKYTIHRALPSHGERTRGLVVPRRRRAVVLSES
jgi:hypothetical protein